MNVILETTVNLKDATIIHNMTAPLIREVLDTKEAHTRQGLLLLGWTPPPTDTPTEVGKSERTDRLGKTDRTPQTLLQLNAFKAFAHRTIYEVGNDV